MSDRPDDDMSHKVLEYLIRSAESIFTEVDAASQSKYVRSLPRLGYGQYD